MLFCCGQGQQGEAEAQALLLLNLVGYELVPHLLCASAPAFAFAYEVSSHATAIFSHRFRLQRTFGIRRNALYGSDESYKKAFFEAGLPNVLRALLLRPGAMCVAEVASRGLVHGI